MKTILSHEMVKIVQKDNAYILSLRMRDGQWAIQSPYEGNQRGLIGAMTLAIDVLAGKVLLVGVEQPVTNSKDHSKVTEIMSGKLLSLTE